MKKCILGIVVQLISLLGFAATEEELFEKGNAFYRQGKYKEAIGVYEQIISSGKIAAELYFNLGNAYFKSGANAAAILNYERALRLAPQDGDIRFNLHMANLKTIDKINPLPEFFLSRWWNALVLEYSADTWAKITIGISCILVFVIIGFLTSSVYILKKMLIVVAGIFVFLFVGSFFVSVAAWEKQSKDTSAILYQNSAYVKSSPDEKSTDLFILHEGIKVEIIDQVGDWKRIRLADGNEGWIKGSELKTI